jgi:type III restriction enzyme
MNRNVNAIAGRLSLRPRSVIRWRSSTASPKSCRPRRERTAQPRLEPHSQRVPHGTDFEREFASLCFALGDRCGQDAAHGRLHRLPASGPRHQQLLRHGSQPDDLQQADHRLHAEHAEVCLQGHLGVRHRRAGDHHGRQLRGKGRHAFRPGAALQGEHLQHLEDQQRGARREVAAHQAALEYIGESYFEYLAGLPDLVLIMDESHRYRASAGVRAINELKPVLGLELTATPFRRGPKGCGAVQERDPRLSARQRPWRMDLSKNLPS